MGSCPLSTPTANIASISTLSKKLAVAIPPLLDAGGPPIFDLALSRMQTTVRSRRAFPLTWGHKNRGLFP